MDLFTFVYSQTSDLKLDEKILSADEQIALSQIEDPHKFEIRKAGRILLRSLLAHFLGEKPEAIQFKRNSRGKPMELYDRVCFSVSYSHETFVVAICKSGQLGVDIERMDLLEGDALEALASSLSEAEKNTVVDFTPPQKLLAYYRAWARKEAFAKALGIGLSAELQYFDTSRSLVTWDKKKFYVDDYSLLANHALAVCSDRQHSKLNFYNSSETIQFVSV